MPQTDQTFTRHNTDDSELSRPTSDFTAAVNIALDFGGVRPQRGNVLVPYDLPATGLNKRLGGFEDGSTGAAVSLLYNDAGQHRIIRYDPTSNGGLGAETTLLEWSGLNLSADMAMQGGILDGLLLYLDAAGVARCFSLKRAAKGDYTPGLLLADPYALHLVPPPPRMVPIAVRAINDSTTDPRTQNNDVAPKAWQFAFQYEYPDGVRTPLGPYTAPLPVAITLSGNSTRDLRNVIRVDYPTGPLAPGASVKAVRLLTRRQNETAWQVAGVMVVGTVFNFYGTTTGEVLTESDGTKLFESIPTSISTMSIARGRLLAGGCREGYAPSWPLAALTAVAGPLPNGTSAAITVYQTSTTYDFTFVGTDGVDRTEQRIRVRFWQVLTGAYPDGSSTYGELSFVGGLYYVLSPAIATFSQVFTYFATDEQPYYNRVIAAISGNIAGAIAPPTSSVTLHGNTSHLVGVAFYDQTGQTAGAEASRLVRVPQQNYVAPVAQNITWTLDATVPVPGWATSYQLLLGRNRNTSFFLQFLCDNLQQFRGDKADGTPNLFPIGTNGLSFVKEVWISLNTLLTSGRGYVYEAGDQITFPSIIATTTPYTPPLTYTILYVRLGYVAISAEALYLFVNINNSNLINQTPLIEIYKPATSTETPILYERGPRYPILNPGTATAAIGITTGVLFGDCTLVAVPNLEAMNPSTRDYGIWLDASRGRAIAANPNGTAVNRSTLIRFSGVKVQGTRINGLGNWEALSQYEDIPQEQGAITRLTVADQTQTDGSILLVTQERGSESISLGRSQIQAADGEPLLAISKQVIGGSNALRGGFGCTDPAAVVAYAGKVFFPCRFRAEVMRYDRNGLTPLGLTHKNSNRLRVVFARYAAAKITACFDPPRKEYRLTFHATDVLPDLTLVYSDKYEAWSDEITCSPEAGMGVDNELITWLGGQLWRHTPDAPAATFFGVLSPVTVTFITSQPGGRMTKVWRRIAINSYGLWLPTRLTNKENQLSRVLPSWLKYAGGIWRAALRRDETTPGQPSPAISLHEGDELQSSALKVTLTAEVGKNDLLTAASLEFFFSSGQGPGS